MPSSFGERLRSEREQRQIPLSTIAAETKINPSLLAGLERDDLSHWPEGIFRRAYIRAYARAIGLDPDPVCREFLELHPDSVDVLPAGASVWPEQARDPQTPQPASALGRVVTSAIGAVPGILGRPDRSRRVVEHHPIAPIPAPAAAPAPTVAAEVPEPPVAQLADLCTRLARRTTGADPSSFLGELAGILDAVGVVLWMPDASRTALRPVAVHGYPDSMRRRLGCVPVSADNAVAAAYRSGDTRLVGGARGTGAVVVPLVGSSACAGVLAVELHAGRERQAWVAAFVAIVAAQLT